MLSAVACHIGASACSETNDERRFAIELDPIRIVATHPIPDGSLPASDPVLICLSDIADPRTVGDREAVLASGEVLVDVETDVQLRAWDVPIDFPCDGSVLVVDPREALRLGITWRLRWRPSLRGWNGAPLATEGPGWFESGEDSVFILEFTATEAMNTTPATSTTTLSDLYEADGVLDPARQTCSCHQQPGRTAAALLDLSDPNRAYEALVVPARARDTGYPMVTPGRPSESFLIHKLLRDEDGHALRTIRGQAMPPGNELPASDLRAIARWIGEGAQR